MTLDKHLTRSVNTEHIDNHQNNTIHLRPIQFRLTQPVTAFPSEILEIGTQAQAHVCRDMPWPTTHGNYSSEKALTASSGAKLSIG